MRLDAFVIAGGRSQRMGSDKARLPFPDGWPMAVHVAMQLRAVARTVALIRRGESDGLPWIWPEGGQVPVVREQDQGERHPLMGLVTA